MLQPSTTSSSRYDEVFTAAARLIARDGFEKASIRALAEETKLSQAALYHYFNSKDDLLYEIQMRTFTALRNSLALRLAPEMPPQDRLRTFIRNHLEFFITNMNELRVCAFELSKLSGERYERVLSIRQNYFNLANEIVQSVLNAVTTASSSKRKKQPDSKRVTLYLFGMLNWIHMWYDVNRRTNVDDITNEISDLLLFGIAYGGVEP
jgi:AcrR family transcriptional regulator